MTLAFAAVVAGIAAYYMLGDQPQALRVALILVGLGAGAAIAMQCDTGRTAWAFARGADVERRKVVWPTRKETIQTTGFVLLIVLAIGFYIWLVDTGLSALVRALVLKES